MDKYMGFELIHAEPISLGNYNKCKGWIIPENENPDTEGYLIVYSDDYNSWCPKEVFEKAHYKVSKDNKIILKNVEDFIIKHETLTYGDKTTVVHAHLKNGFVITEASSCVDIANYNIVIGEQICLEKIFDQVWKLLGFLLQTAKNGV